MNKRFEFITISALCVSLMVPVIKDTYINQYEYEEYEAWRSTVTEFSEYCLEHEKLTANDIDDVISDSDSLIKKKISSGVRSMIPRWHRMRFWLK